MTRLPQPGSDSGVWGDVLNDFLSQVHAADGSLKPDSVGSDQLRANSVAAYALAPNSVTNGALASNAVTAAIIADGTITESLLDTTLRAKLNEAPAVSSVAGKTGDVTLTKADVGLAGVDNTSDIDKPLSTVQQTALNSKAGVVVGASGSTLKTASIQTHPESNNYNHLPYLFNDIAYNNIRGGSVIFRRNGIVEAYDATSAFQPDVTYSGFSISTNDVVTIEVTLCRSIIYSAAWGICMSEAYRARNVVIELWDSVANVWVTATTRANDTIGIAMIRHAGGGNGGANPSTKVRYTLSNFSSYTGDVCRVTNIFVVSYRSGLLSETFVPRGGGDLYAPIRHPRYSAVARPSASVSGAGAEIYDVTLNKPVWSDGANWRDASGVIV